MDIIVHIAVSIFLALLHVFTHLAVLMFTSIVGILAALVGIGLLVVAFTGGLGFGIRRARRK